MTSKGSIQTVALLGSLLSCVPGCKKGGHGDSAPPVDPAGYLLVLDGPIRTDRILSSNEPARIRISGRIRNRSVDPVRAEFSGTIANNPDCFALGADWSKGWFFSTEIAPDTAAPYKIVFDEGDRQGCGPPPRLRFDLWGSKEDGTRFSTSSNPEDPDPYVVGYAVEW